MTSNKPKNKKTLTDFKTTLRGFKIFNEATGELPPFLKQNLVDEARNIKVFKNDEYAYIKTFYFQFLKLCFEIEDVDYDTKINNFIQFVQANTELLDISYKYSRDFIPPPQLKDILFQFLEQLSECKQAVETTLSRYPAVGDMLINFFVNYLLKFHPEQSNENKMKEHSKKYNFNNFQAVEHLSKQFLVDIVQYDKCIQFTDSQVYLLKENQQNIYMIYIDQTKVRRNSRISPPESDGQLPSNKSLNSGNYQVIKFDAPDIVFAEIDQSIIKIDVGNYAQEKKPIGTNLVSTGFNSNSSTISEKQEQYDIDSTNNLNKPQIKSSIKTSNKNPNSSRPSNLQKLADLFSADKNQNDHKQNSNQNRQFKKKSNLTREFTNTFILDNIITEPYRSQIKQMKNKVRQQRQSIKPFNL